MRSSNIGGQAVMEGIMMRHKDKYSIAVRRPDNEIELKVEDYRSVLGNAKFLKYPLREMKRMKKRQKQTQHFPRKSARRRKKRKISSLNGCYM